MKSYPIGVPFKKLGNRLEELNKELNKHGMAIRAESVSTLEFGDPQREVATEMTLSVCLFDKPIFQKDNFIKRLFKKNND